MKETWRVESQSYNRATGPPMVNEQSKIQTTCPNQKGGRGLYLETGHEARKQQNQVREVGEASGFCKCSKRGGLRYITVVSLRSPRYYVDEGRGVEKPGQEQVPSTGSLWPSRL